jgi:hypothetical protein
LDLFNHRLVAVLSVWPFTILIFPLNIWKVQRVILPISGLLEKLIGLKTAENWHVRCNILTGHWNVLFMKTIFFLILQNVKVRLLFRKYLYLHIIKYFIIWLALPGFCTAIPGFWFVDVRAVFCVSRPRDCIFRIGPG